MRVEKNKIKSINKIKIIFFLKNGKFFSFSGLTRRMTSFSTDNGQTLLFLLVWCSLSRCSLFLVVHRSLYSGGKRGVGYLVPSPSICLFVFFFVLFGFQKVFQQKWSIDERIQFFFK